MRSRNRVRVVVVVALLAVAGATVGLAQSLGGDPGFDAAAWRSATDARDLDAGLIPEPPQIVVCDASFISLKLVLTKPLALAAPGARLIVTGCRLRETRPGMLESVIHDSSGLSRHPTPHLPVAMSGTGDLFAGLVTAGLGRGRTLPQAVDFAQAQTARALKRAAKLGTREVVLTDPDFRAALLTL